MVNHALPCEPMNARLLQLYLERRRRRGSWVLRATPAEDPGLDLLEQLRTPPSTRAARGPSRAPHGAARPPAPPAQGLPLPGGGSFHPMGSARAAAPARRTVWAPGAW